MTRTQAWLDILERSALTALEATLGLLVVDGLFINLPDGATWTTALTTTVITFLWNVVRRRQETLTR